ncbi:MAG: ComF family protein [Lachnospiraceae bacterium]|nr:ComF family protein [Lachnospiraceae bacterium]
MKRHKWITFILDILYPRKCPVCDRIITPKGALICPPCRKRVSFIAEPRCKKCGKALMFAEREYCENCCTQEHRFYCGVALMNYDSVSRKVLSDLKYRGKRDNADYVAAEMALRLRQEVERMDADALIPVPVHPRRKRLRGFNQAELLANRLGERLSIPVRNDLLIRIKNTRPQKELGSLGRLNNLLKAFTVRRWDAKLRRVILVDDIYTTGSTAEACTRVLLAAGAERVYVLSAAIGKDR